MKGLDFFCIQGLLLCPQAEIARKNQRLKNREEAFSTRFSRSSNKLYKLKAPISCFYFFSSQVFKEHKTGKKTLQELIIHRCKKFYILFILLYN